MYMYMYMMYVTLSDMVIPLLLQEHCFSGIAVKQVLRIENRKLHNQLTSTVQTIMDQRPDSIPPHHHVRDLVEYLFLVWNPGMTVCWWLLWWIVYGMCNHCLNHLHMYMYIHVVSCGVGNLCRVMFLLIRPKCTLWGTLYNIIFVDARSRVQGYTCTCIYNVHVLKICTMYMKTGNCTLCMHVRKTQDTVIKMKQRNTTQYKP